jgi:DNA-binding LacI/PurR family transcriptional regulator
VAEFAHVRDSSTEPVISVRPQGHSWAYAAPLTTFALPGDIGRHAANLLLQRLRGDSLQPQRLLLPARFIQRRSTAAPPRLVREAGSTAAD